MRASTRPPLRARAPLRARPAFRPTRPALPPPAALPPYVDADAAAEIEEPAARVVLEALQRTPLQVPGVGTVAAAWVGNGVDAGSSDVPPVVLLHGFDSSLLEFRRLLPRLAADGVPAYGVDLVGWGFSDCTPFIPRDGAPRPPLGPPQKRDHLAAFIDTVLGGRPVVLLGTSLGGAVALDFALARPELVAGLVLVAPQTYTDGIGPLQSLPEWAARLGVKVLRTTALRGAANKMAYFDVPTYATQDAMRIGRLHTHAAGWEDANVAFIQSGGYAMSSGPAELGRRGEPPTLIVWGRDDEILPPKESVDRIRSDIKHADFVWADACSHVPHLEQPAVLADAVAAFAGRLKKKESVEK